MKIKYSRDVDILTIEFDGELPIVDGIQLENAIFNLNSADEPVIIEIMQARHFVTSLMEAVMQPEASAGD